MHILEPYEAEFREALARSDHANARETLHAMLQLDPLDKDGRVENALGELQDQGPERQGAAPEEDWFDFIDRLDTLDGEPLETEFGQWLLRFEAAPSLEVLRRVKRIAGRLSSVGLLGEYVTEFGPEPPPVRDTVSAKPHPSRRVRRKNKQPSIFRSRLRQLGGGATNFISMLKDEK